MGTEEVFQCVSGRCFGKKNHVHASNRLTRKISQFFSSVVRTVFPSALSNFLAVFGFGKPTERPCPFLICIREPGFGRRQNGFRVPTIFDFGQYHLDRDRLDSRDG